MRPLNRHIQETHKHNHTHQHLDGDDDDDDGNDDDDDDLPTTASVSPHLASRSKLCVSPNDQSMALSTPCLAAPVCGALNDHCSRCFPGATWRTCTSCTWWTERPRVEGRAGVGWATASPAWCFARSTRSSATRRRYPTWKTPSPRKSETKSKKKSKRVRSI